MRGALRWRWIVLTVAILALVIGASWLFRPTTHTSTPRPAVIPAARLDLAQTAFSAWLADRASSDGLAALELSDVSGQIIAQSGAMQHDGRWAATARATWAYRDADPRAATVDLTVDLQAREGQVQVLGVTSPGRVPLWLAGDAATSRTGDTVVLTGSGIDHDDYARWASQAVAVVHRTLPEADGTLVVEVPRSTADLERTLGAPSGTYATVAAVTASVDGSGEAGSPVHVFVNPEVMAKLDDASAQIVISHEATHALTGAALDTQRPIWLSEGFADYVALRATRVPITRSAGQIIAQVRSEGVPKHLPGQAEFNAGSPHFGASYEAAWLANRLLATDAGEAGLVEVYDAVGAGTDLDEALRASTGYGVDGLTRKWQQRLREACDSVVISARSTQVVR